MRLTPIALAAILAASPLGVPISARAEPAQEAGSAFGACLAAVIDKAPVADIKGQDVQIRRDPGNGACSVEVLDGDIAPVRQAVLDAMAKRRERFSPAKTRWDPGAFASREAFCNAALVRRNLTVVVSAALPGSKGPRLIATAVETPERDPRCDADKGLQKP